jgi:hypothetical protein
MKALRIIKIVFILCLALGAQAQENVVSDVFRDTRVVNGQSVRTNEEGVMKFIITHRFGTLNSGKNNLFGLDEAKMRIGLDYGITNNLTIGAGRGNYKDNIDMFVKWNLLEQSTKSPIAVTGLFSTSIKTDPFKIALQPVVTGKHRFVYATQVMVARKFSDNISLQITPTYLHRNLVDSTQGTNGVFGLGFAGRRKISKKLTILSEYYLSSKSQVGDSKKNVFSVGVEFDSKGHAFQLMLTNTQGMTERFYLGDTESDWLDGDIHLGFNVTRDFKVKGRKYK